LAADWGGLPFPAIHPIYFLRLLVSDTILDVVAVHKRTSNRFSNPVSNFI